MPGGVPVSIPGGVPNSMHSGIPNSMPSGVPMSIPGGVPMSMPGGVSMSMPGGVPMSMPGGVPISMSGGVPGSMPNNSMPGAVPHGMSSMSGINTSAPSVSTQSHPYGVGPNTSMPIASMQNAPSSSTPPNVVPSSSVESEERIIIWNGTLEWQEKGKGNQGNLRNSRVARSWFKVARKGEKKNLECRGKRRNKGRSGVARKEERYRHTVIQKKIGWKTAVLKLFLWEYCHTSLRRYCINVSIVSSWTSPPSTDIYSL